MTAALQQATAERMAREEAARTRTLADAFDSHASRQRGKPFDPLIAPKRAFMAGALEVLLMLKEGATADQLRAEILGFARTIGTPAERARN